MPTLREIADESVLYESRVDEQQPDGEIKEVVLADPVKVTVNPPIVKPSPVFEIGDSQTVIPTKLIVPPVSERPVVIVDEQKLMDTFPPELAIKIVKDIQSDIPINTEIAEILVTEKIAVASNVAEHENPLIDVRHSSEAIRSISKITPPAPTPRVAVPVTQRSQAIREVDMQHEPIIKPAEPGSEPLKEPIKKEPLKKVKEVKESASGRTGEAEKQMNIFQKYFDDLVTEIAKLI